MRRRRRSRFVRERETELIERVQAGVGREDGLGAAGAADVLAALTEQHVEALLIDERFDAGGVRCTSCGWLGPAGSATGCPAEGSPVEQIDDVGEAAAERALVQDAEVVVVRDRPELGSLGGIAAVLRF